MVTAIDLPLNAWSEAFGGGQGKAVPRISQGCSNRTFPVRALYQVLGTQLVPSFPFHLGISFLKLNMRKKGTVIVNGILENFH